MEPGSNKNALSSSSSFLSEPLRPLPLHPVPIRLQPFHRMPLKPIPIRPTRFIQLPLPPPPPLLPPPLPALLPLESPSLIPPIVSRLSAGNPIMIPLLKIGSVEYREHQKLLHKMMNCVSEPIRNRINCIEYYKKMEYNMEQLRKHPSDKSTYTKLLSLHLHVDSIKATSRHLFPEYKGRKKTMSAKDFLASFVNRIREQDLLSANMEKINDPSPSCAPTPMIVENTIPKNSINQGASCSYNHVELSRSIFNNIHAPSTSSMNIPALTQPSTSDGAVPGTSRDFYEHMQH